MGYMGVGYWGWAVIVGVAVGVSWWFGECEVEGIGCGSECVCGWGGLGWLWESIHLMCGVEGGYR